MPMKATFTKQQSLSRGSSESHHYGPPHMCLIGARWTLVSRGEGNDSQGSKGKVYRNTQQSIALKHVH